MKEKIYDCKFINNEYLNEQEEREIQLQYYMLLNEEKGTYGIEIFKKEKSNLGFQNEESSLVKEYTDDKAKVLETIDLLGRNKVTPMCLNEIIKEI